MSIKAFIKKVCVQDAVYWEFNGLDAFNAPQWLEPREIKVRWDSETELNTKNQGKQYAQKTQILTPNEIKEESYVWLGRLVDLPVGPDPSELPDSYEVKAVDRTPLFRSKTFDVFVAYL